MPKSLKSVPWYQNPQAIVSVLVGFGAIGGWVVSQFVADAKQQVKIEQVEDQVEEIENQVKTQDQEIEQTAVQYQLIQQQLGVVVESLKEIKQQKR